MGFVDSMRKLVGIEEYEDDIEVTQEEINEYKRMNAAPEKSAADYSAPRREEPVSISSPISFSNDVKPLMKSQSKPSQDQKISMNQSGQFKMVVIEPKSLDECRKLVDNLRARKPIIINLEKVETDLARKMFDFLGGATYALSGTVQRINQNIYLFAPNNVDIKAIVDRATEAGKPSGSNPWK